MIYQFISLLFVIIWSITLLLLVKANISKISWINVQKPNVRAFLYIFFRCSILAGVPHHHEENGKNPNMKKKFIVTVNKS